MAMKLEIHYLRDLEMYKIDEEILIKILKVSKNIRLCWGSEYADFIFKCPLNDNNINIDLVIEDLHSKKYPVGMCPVSGSDSIFGFKVPVKVHTLKEFCELSKNSETLFAINANLGNFQNILERKDLFQSSKITSYIDYSQIVSDLEEEGMLETFSSNNILCLDERRFSFTNKFFDTFPETKKYTGKTYEVDSLGTSFHSELTEYLVTLSSIYFKALETN